MEHSTDSYRQMHEMIEQRVELILLAAALLAGVLIGIAASFQDAPLPMTLLGLALIGTALLLLWAKERAYPGFTWVTAIAVLIDVTAIVYVINTPFALCLMILPASVTLVIRTPKAGALVAALSSVLVYLWSPRLGLAASGMIALLSVLWAVQLLLWIVLAWAEERVAWALQNYSEGQLLLDEARQQRYAVKKTQEDLALANVQLARLTDRLAHMTHLAEDARRTKEEFLANVSHELRTPLNMIIGFSELFTQNPEIYREHIPSSLLADILVIQRNAQHLSGLVDDILDLSSAEAGRLALNKEWVGMSAVVEEAVSAVAPLMSAKNLQVVLDIDQDLPPIYGDRVRLRQVVLNLLSNAGRLTEQGFVAVGLHRQADALVCSVQDTGPGIALEDQQRIFEPFIQAGDVLRRVQGTGLGLSISRRLIEMHQGRMRLESQLGVGSTFSFSLPLTSQGAAPPDTMSRWFSPYHQFDVREGPSQAPMPAVAARYLVLDAEGELSKRLTHYVRDASIQSVESIAQAASQLEGNPAQALLINDAVVENALADLDLGALPLGTPAVICWVPGDQQAAKRLGARHYLVKPVRQQALCQILDEQGEALKTILVVDDDREANRLLVRMIASTGRLYTILRATNGARALTLLRERQPGLVLLDMVMPVMDGYQLLREKAADPAIRDIPVVAVSGQDPAQGLARGICMTIVCPGGVKLDDLLACVQAIGRDGAS